MHLGKYVAELIHDDESKAKVFYECMPETNQNRVGVIIFALQIYLWRTIRFSKTFGTVEFGGIF